jgi:hypothetical protein
LVESADATAAIRLEPIDALALDDTACRDTLFDQHQEATPATFLTST